MTTPALPVCPVCGGSRLWPHPGGLVYQHRTQCQLRDADDARVAADHETRGRRRPVTATERTLLTAAGIVLPADEVDPVSGSVIRHNASAVPVGVTASTTKRVYAVRDGVLVSMVKPSSGTPRWTPVDTDPPLPPAA